MKVPDWARRHGDVALALALATSITVEMLAWADHDVLEGVAAALLLTLPIALRRRATLVMFLLTGLGQYAVTRTQPGFDNDSMTLVVTFFLVLYALGRHTSGLEAWIAAGLLVAEATLFLQQDVGLAHADPGDVAFTVMFIGAPWATGLTLRLRREREQFLGAENDRLRREQTERAARAVAEERSRIARELHDVVSHAISVTVLQARGARRALESDPQAVRRALDAIEQTNTAALGDMRRLLAVLRDTEPESGSASDRAPQPSLTNLDRLVDHLRQSGVSVRVEVQGSAESVPPGVDLSAYRIVQEALTNVLKHASDAHAVVQLDYRANELALTVLDDGVAASSSTHVPGHGLVGIRERVAVVGGDVEAGPVDGGGFRVSARLPYALELS